MYPGSFEDVIGPGGPGCGLGAGKKTWVYQV
jgi:hypothetical protein